MHIMDIIINMCIYEIENVYVKIQKVAYHGIVFRAKIP